MVGAASGAVIAGAGVDGNVWLPNCAAVTTSGAEVPRPSSPGACINGLADTGT